MSNSNLARLNAGFGIPGKIVFDAGPGGLTVVDLKSAHSEARVALHGAHVMHFQLRGESPVLWMSAESRFEDGKPIRGGIPVCWPWFGPHPVDASKPAHGFARLMAWKVLETQELPGGDLQLTLGLNSSEETLAVWPHDFRLEMRIQAGRELSAALFMYNSGQDEMRLTMAMHSYFNIGAIRNISIAGLEDTRYSSKLEGEGILQKGLISIQSETDRVYCHTEADCVINDPDLRRRIIISKQGGRSTVVWNPWIDKSGIMPDFGNEEYLGMVCVETANAAEDAVFVPPGGSHTISAVIRVESAGSRV